MSAPTVGVGATAVVIAAVAGAVGLVPRDGVALVVGLEVVELVGFPGVAVLLATPGLD